MVPLPVSVEVTTNDRELAVRQALTFAGWGENIVVKITIHGPNGEIENLELIHELASKYNIRVNATAMMSAQQCFLAAMAGASYVSIFGGRVNNMGYNACGEIIRLRKVLDQGQLKAEIIVGSTREILNVIEWLEAGAHIVTVTPDILKGMIVHPYSKETVQMFLRDAEKAEEALRIQIPQLALTPAVEQRLLKRVPVQCVARYIYDPANENPPTARVINLGMGGAFLEALDLLPYGSPVAFHLIFSERRVVEVRARVVHVQSNTHSPNRVGVCFTELSDHDREVLAREIQLADMAAPSDRQKQNSFQPSIATLGVAEK